MNAPATLWIPGPIPTLNELFEARMVMTKGGTNGKRGQRGNRYSEIKKQWAALITYLVRQAQLRPCGPSAITFVHYMRDRRLDPDGFTSGAAKLVLDGLVKADVLPNDGWEDVLDLRHHWLVTPEPCRLGARVFLEPGAAESMGRDIALRRCQVVNSPRDLDVRAPVIQARSGRKTAAVRADTAESVLARIRAAHRA